ncbi:zinc ribbon domain-containing protein, partial [Aeromonas caviae]|uniref:zinc ribbon domain-containing protein n=1 Tax=Aeromonas caviae TaxID=648 RepID=UPI00338E9E81
TSQQCACCGHTAKDNRQTQSQFKCAACGYEANADVNGARNILGSSRDLGEVEVDRQGAGKLAVSKHTTTITLLSPCIILILPP